MTPFIPSSGSPVSFTPVSGPMAVVFRAGDQTWDEPMIGWAVVAVHAEPTELGVEVDTTIEAVVLDEGYPATISEYRRGRDSIDSWQVTERPAVLGGRSRDANPPVREASRT